MTTKTNYDYIQTAKSDNGKYECERCQTEFNDPSEVFWAECGDYSKKHGVPLCQECCEDQQENWNEESEEEEGKCDCCEASLGEDEHIFCFTRGDEEKTMCRVCGDDTHEEMKAEGWMRDDDDCDDRDAPNVYPYKKCSVCGERKSCGNYKENDWYCETCAEEEDHATASSPTREKKEEDTKDILYWGVTDGYLTIYKLPSSVVLPDDCDFGACFGNKWCLGEEWGSLAALNFRDITQKMIDEEDFSE